MASTAVIAIGAIIMSNLFLLDTVKVQLDFLWLGMSLLGIAYALIIATGMLGQDITQGIAYLFLPHMQRHAYLLARILGIIAGLLLLLTLMTLVSMLSLAWGLNHSSAAAIHGVTLWAATILGSVALLQSLTVLSIVTFICSWASGPIEMMLFSSAFTGLAYLLPSVMQAMTSHVVMTQIPGWTAALIHAVDYLFPDMTGAQLALSVAHGLPLPPIEISWFLIAQIGYMMTLSAIGFLLFARRDL